MDLWLDFSINPTTSFLEVLFLASFLELDMKRHKKSISLKMNNLSVLNNQFII